MFRSVRAVDEDALTSIQSVTGDSFASLSRNMGRETLQRAFMY